MTAQEAARLALSPEDRQRLDVARRKALVAHMRQRMAFEVIWYFEESDWNTYVYLEDEHGLFPVDLPSGTTQEPLTVCCAVAKVLAAEVRGEHAYLMLGVVPTVTSCMMGERAPLKPAHAEKVVVAQQYYEKGVRAGIEEERGRVVALWHKLVSHHHVEAGPVEAALVTFSREAFSPTITR